MAKEKKKSCFVIGPIGEPGSYIRRRADDLQKYIIEPALADSEYDTPKRADQIGEPGLISEHIIRHLLEDDLVIADLTRAKPNVYYEIAARHVAPNNHMIYLIDEGHTPPFDAKDVRCIPIGTGLGAPLKAVESLKEAIAELPPPGQIQLNPITACITIQLLRQSDDRKDKLINQLSILTEESNAEKRHLIEVSLKLSDLIYEKLNKIDQTMENLQSQLGSPSVAVAEGARHATDAKSKWSDVLWELSSLRNLADALRSTAEELAKRDQARDSNSNK